jgi:hypothetical protein
MIWNKKYLKKEKLITLTAVLSIYFLFNLPCIYITGRFLSWLEVFIYGKVFNTALSLLFFLVIIAINWYSVRKGVPGKIGRFIRNRFVRKKYFKGTAWYIWISLGVIFLILFRIWNIDYVVSQRINQLLMITGLSPEWLKEKPIRWGSQAKKLHDPDKIIESNIFSDQGRFLRTYRWDEVIKREEKRFGIQPNLLAGLIMQESMGNPLQLNSINDGGAGLMMFQPGTARECGLKVYGNSDATGRDTRHGMHLRKLVVEYNFDYGRLSSADERFNIEKSVRAGAGYLERLKKKHGSWDDALSAYNRGTPAIFPNTTSHVRMVRHFQKYYASKSKNPAF